MTDQMIPADKVRVVRDIHLEEAKLVSITDAEREIHQRVADAMEALLLTPPRPTLADMTPEGRRECQWMQADIIVGHDPLVITHIERSDGTATILDRNGRYDEVPADEVTPRPDLPRLEWPSSKKVAPAPAPALPDGWLLADHPGYGRVIVTSASTSLDSNEYVYIVLPTDDSKGHDWLFCPTDRLTYLNGDGEPANTVKVGDLIQSADDPRIAALPVGSILLDRDEEATTKRLGSWTGVGNTPNEGEGDTYGPWTVLHIPKGADQ